LDETSTVETEGLLESDGESVCQSFEMLEELEAREIVEELLEVHGVAPRKKADGIVRLIYEDVNELNSRMTDNEKLNKIRDVIDELEVDIAAFNEHRMNLRHKDNRNGFSQLFRGGEADIRSVAANNVHENVGRVQEGGTALLVFGALIEQ